MNRFDLTSRLVAKLKNEEAVIGGIGNTNFDLWAAGHRPQNFYMLGGLGLAFPIALGVALAQPNRRKVALEGDGSLLMQLGSLTTIATLAPKNLTMVVMDNGVYQITGAQPTPAAAVADIVAIAVASGLRNSTWAADEECFERLIDQSMSAFGANPDRRAHRRQAGRRRHPPRSRADQGALHARHRAWGNRYNPVAFWASVHVKATRRARNDGQFVVVWTVRALTTQPSQGRVIGIQRADVLFERDEFHSFNDYLDSGRCGGLRNTRSADISTSRLRSRSERRTRLRLYPGRIGIRCGLPPQPMGEGVFRFPSS